MSLERTFALPSCRHCSPSLSLSSNQTLIQMFLHSHCKGFPESNLKQTQTDFRNRKVLSLYAAQTEHCKYSFVHISIEKRSYNVDKFELRSALQESVAKLLSLRFLWIENRMKIKKTVQNICLKTSHIGLKWTKKEIHKILTDIEAWNCWRRPS